MTSTPSSETAAVGGHTVKQRFPDLAAEVLQDGHIDPITGPRCMVQMKEGPQYGLYRIAHTDEVLTAGTKVLIDGITGRALSQEQSA